MIAEDEGVIAESEGVILASLSFAFGTGESVENLPWSKALGNRLRRKKGVQSMKFK